MIATAEVYSPWFFKDGWKNTPAIMEITLRCLHRSRMFYSNYREVNREYELNALGSMVRVKVVLVK